MMTHDIPTPKKGEKIQTIMMTDPISQIVTGHDLLVAKTTDTIQKVIKIFKEYNKDCCLVFKKKKLVGILSQRDIVNKVAGKVSELSKTTVESVMTPNPEYVKMEDPLAFAVNKMSVGGYRHVPVLSDGGTPVSIVAIRDVLSYLERRD